MDIKKTPLAVATFLGLVSLFCGLLVWLLPDFSRSIFQTWFHGINLSVVWDTTTMSFGKLIIGLISAFIAGYITTWIFVKIYKAIVK